MKIETGNSGSGSDDGGGGNDCRSIFYRQMHEGLRKIDGGIWKFS